MPIIQSMLDQDFYKLTMASAVLFYMRATGRKNIPARFVFRDRKQDRPFNKAFLDAFRNEVESMRDLRLTDDEARWLSLKVPYLSIDFIEWYRNFRYDPSNLIFYINEQGELQLEYQGPQWVQEMMWEVPLMCIASELFFKHCDTDWTFDEEEQVQKFRNKARKMDRLYWCDFGTRRRRSFATQDIVCREGAKFASKPGEPGFLGTSNVYLAYRYDLTPQGTQAHEWTQAMSALHGVRFANRYAMQYWVEAFQGNAGIALPDTYGTDGFLQEFNGLYARIFDGTRQDSGKPLTYLDKMLRHYHGLGMKTRDRRLVFSDSLTDDKALSVNDAVNRTIQDGYGIGTFLSNDYDNSPPLNMVIKMANCDGRPVVKLSDDPGKAIGERDALRVARWEYGLANLDEEIPA